MPQFDVHARPAGQGLLLDCQADLLSHLNTRMVVPLIPIDGAPKPAGRLNPAFDIDGQHYIMVTQYAAAVELREFGHRIASLGDKRDEIIAALDVLLTGV